MDLKNFTVKDVTTEIIDIGLSLTSGVYFYIMSPRVTLGKLTARVPFLIPYNPPKIEISCPGANETRNMIGIGEINLLQKPKLSTIRWSSFFPHNTRMPEVRTKDLFLPPVAYIEAFQLARNMREPLRLVVTNIGINQLVTIENFEWWHEGGEYEDKYYSIEFKEYKQYKPKDLTSTETKVENTTATPETADKTITLNPESKKVQQKAGSSLGKPAAGTISLDPVEATIGAAVAFYGETDKLFGAGGMTVKNDHGSVISIDNSNKEALVKTPNKTVTVKKENLSV